MMSINSYSDKIHFYNDGDHHSYVYSENNAKNPIQPRAVYIQVIRIPVRNTQSTSAFTLPKMRIKSIFS